ncbi:MAG: FAD-binding oxidoreductase [Rhizobiaceae bacterium]|nr:FAD-binding oxidoreductase [Rhizobiaceae bacterium]
MMALLERLRDLLGPSGFVADGEDRAPFERDWTGVYRGEALAVAMPSAVDELRAVVRLAAEAGIAIVPQGGNTGMCAGAVPRERSLLLSTKRLDAIRSVDPRDWSVTAEAGVVLADLQAAAQSVDRFFPLRLGSEGSATIGGLVSTNAGGTRAVRYGVMRDLVLGLEVVLPDGRLWNGLSRLRKDVTGYDLRHLFIGAEGTLGIVTAATLRLYPAEPAIASAFCGVPSVASAMEFLDIARQKSCDAIVTFEIMSKPCIDLAAAHVDGVRRPLAGEHRWHVLVEIAAHDGAARLESCLVGAMERGVVADAVIAQSLADAAGFWRIREGVVEAQPRLGLSIKHDVSVPLDAVAAFCERAEAEMRRRLPASIPLFLGHCGDGNIHANLAQARTPADIFTASTARLTAAIHDIAEALGGSISAEHGIGFKKRDEFLARTDPVEFDLMSRIKRALDPADKMNPGVLMPPMQQREAAE